MFTTSIATICPIISRLRIIYWLYSLSSTFISITYSFHNWRPLSPLPFTHFAQPSSLLPSGSHQFVPCIYSSESAFCFFIHFSYVPIMSGIINTIQIYVGKITILTPGSRTTLEQISQTMYFRGLFVSVSILNTLYSFNNYLLTISTRLETGWRDGAEGRTFSVKRVACVEYLKGEEHDVLSKERRQR